MRKLENVIEDPPVSDGRGGWRVNWDALRRAVDDAGGRWVRLVDPRSSGYTKSLSKKLGNGYEIKTRQLDDDNRRRIHIYIRRIGG